MLPCAFATLTAALFLCARAFAKLEVHISIGNGIINGSTDGHVQLLFAPGGTDPLDDTDVTSTPNYFFGQNVFGLNASSLVTLSGGGNDNTATGLFGWPNVSLDDVAPGTYSVQAFLNIYETVKRADGSEVSLRFPCGDGNDAVGGYGTPQTSVANVTVTGGGGNDQIIDLVFNGVTHSENFTGSEIGGCQQGNYADTELLKHVKIRSNVLSAWWNRDMFVGASVLLPYGYNASDTATRYPVIYAQEHWAAGRGAYGYPLWDYFTAIWNTGVVPRTISTAARATPKAIFVVFRHENPYYRDSYAVNTANLGPWGDAINDELIPQLDAMFNTIAEPYGRIQQGVSTGGWESAASVIFRPDLFGVCFASFPDSLDFHRLQDLPLYTSKNAYVRDDGSDIISIRHIDSNGVQTNVTTVAQENHWELTYGTSSRSILGQWDAWHAVYGVQGLNGRPLAPWDKVTGEIYPEAVEYWKKMDLAEYITSNWDNELNLSQALRGRLFFYVGLIDEYFLNEGLAAFQSQIEANQGGAGWANFTYLPGLDHGGLYNNLDIWDYLDLLVTWSKDHAPDGKTPLAPSATAATLRGNKFDNVMAYGGHQAALARQAPPTLEGTTATVGKWDPGMALTAQWIVNGQASGDAFAVAQGGQAVFTGNKTGLLEIEVMGRKRDYVDETRRSNAVNFG